ncbi:MAG TPA: VTT domain-containing protein [Candidatus Limnocylindrales bacterium]|nr:VTT domain-containing protein [Candidatus Limnocylindrales bacterium]
METRTILIEGRNCWRIAGAGRVAFLVDGADYFAAFAAAASRSQHSILIAGWDMDSRTRLFRDDRPRDLPVELGSFMDAIVSRRRGLHAYLLNWDFNAFFVFNREALPVIKWELNTHRRLHFHLDGNHPVGGSHHQKIAAIDDAIAFAGGLDLTEYRWDTPEHRVPDPRRVTFGGESYPPFHDVMMAVEGEAAAALGDLFRERWRRATGKRLRRPARLEGDPWPPDLVPNLENVRVGIARTVPAMGDGPEVREVETLFLDSIAAARRFLYIENQYLTSHSIGTAIAARLQEEDGPEIVIILPRVSSGIFEETAMGVLRYRLLRRLRAADHSGKLAVYCPVPEGDPDGTVTVHSKVMIVDDALVRVGSANLTNRSMGLDTECDLAVESGGDAKIEESIAALRSRLVGEHLGVDPGQVAQFLADRGSLIGTIEALRGPGRTLIPLTGEVPEWQDRLLPETVLLDWERPVDSDELLREILPGNVRESIRPSLIRGVAILLTIFAMGAAWVWTPLRNWIDLDTVTRIAVSIKEMPTAPFLAIGAYVVGGLVVFPVSLLILATVFAFGPVAGFAYSLLGSFLSAVMTFGIGKALGRRTMRLIAGRRLLRLGRLLRRRGLIAMATVRLVPVAPFTVVNVTAGTFNVRFLDFALGTLIGMAPGIFTIAVFGERLEHAIRYPGFKSFAVLAVLVALIVLAAGWIRQRLGKEEPPPEASRGR